MKNVIFFFLTISLAVIISSCGGYVGSDDQTDVQDSLGHELLIGTYVFKPTVEQAKRLNLNANEPITLRLTTDSMPIKPGRYIGKYYIDKMILMLNSSPIGAYSSTWQYHYSHQMKNNTLELGQPYKTNNDLFYRIERGIDNDTLHIAGYAADPEYEIMRLVDFKKIK